MNQKKGFALGLVLTLVFVVALTITGAVFLVTKAREATPSAWLYPIQAASHKIELWLTPGRKAKAIVLLNFADHEASDIERLTTEKEFEDILEESRELRRKLEDVAEQAIEIESVGEDADDLNAELKRVAEKAVTNLTLANEQASGADKGKIVLEITLFGIFIK